MDKKKFNRYFSYILNRRIIRNITPARWYLSSRYYFYMGQKLNLKNPCTYNEKLQWLKLYDHKNEYTMMVDKYEVRDFISRKIGEEYLVPLIGGPWNKAEDIDFNNLPNQFVLKCTHDSGNVIICRDKATFDIEAAKEKLRECLKVNFYWVGREWPYRNVKPRIIAEKYMDDDSGCGLRDYKFFCFDGTPRLMYIASDRGSATEKVKFDFFDMEFNHLKLKHGYENSNKDIKCPSAFEKMKNKASILSRGIPHVRVDFYEIHGHIYFSELTFFHHSGFVQFEPHDWDKKIGDWIFIDII